MSMSPIRVLVVDDSAVMRELICDIFGQEPGIEVAGTASSGLRALELIPKLKPDVVTLDVQMPGMDGLETLKRIQAKHPLPVIMVSSLTQLGAETTLEALELGAMDYVPKPQNLHESQAEFAQDLVRKVRVMAHIDVRRLLEVRRKRKQKQARQAAAPAPTRTAASPLLTESQLADKCIAIGISTGGPPALLRVFETLEPPMPPILIVQHMPPKFTAAFAWRLDSRSSLSVKEARTGDLLQVNHVYLAPGGQHLQIRKDLQKVKTWVRNGQPVSGHKPSVDVLMNSVARIYGPNAIGVIMTGMGRDGVAGCAAIREAGGYVLGQDEQSSDVYGMNKIAYQEGHVDRQFSLDETAEVLREVMAQRWAQVPVG